MVRSQDGQATLVLQVLKYVAASMLLVVVPYGLALLIVALLVWRLAIRMVGHSRLCAVLEAGLIVVGAAILTPRTTVLIIGAWLGLPLLTDAAMVRPPRTSRG